MKLIGNCFRAEGTVKEAPYVKVKVKGKSCLCRIDTGADITIIPIDLLPFDSAVVKKLSIRLGSGKTSQRSTFQVALEIEGVQFNPSEGVLTTISEVGLLGIDILENFRLVLERGKYTLELLEEGDQDDSDRGA